LGSAHIVPTPGYQQDVDTILVQQQILSIINSKPSAHSQL
jgi:hypothetical protein